MKKFILPLTNSLKSRCNLLVKCFGSLKVLSILLLTIYFVISFEFCFAQISRTQIISNANSFVTFSWTANTCNLWSGTNCGGRNVYAATPSNSTQRGWVKVGTNISMPYSWGGYSTTAQHNSAMASCKSAGDICSAGTVGGNCSGQGSNGAGLSCTSGLDCSGFVTRAWGLSVSHLGTGQLPSYSSSIPLSQTQPGDILNDVGSHVRLVETNYGNGNYRVIEASGTDWKTAYHTYTAAQLASYDPRCPISSIVTGGCGSVAAPSNDNCSSAISLTPNTSCNTTSGDIAGATQSYAASGCPSGLIQDVWYKFTAASNGTYTIRLTPSSSMDGVVEVRQGSCTGNVLGCKDSGGGNGGVENLDVTVTNGLTYYVRIYEYNSAGNTTPPLTTSFKICVTGANSSNCSITSFNPNSITRNPESFSSSSGDDIILNGQPNCSFSVSESCSWLTVTPTSGTTNSVGQALLNYTLEANTLTSSRSCTVSVNGSTFTIKQNGCTYDFYPTTKSVSALGSTYNLDIDSYSPCTWTIQNSNSWVHLSQTSGTGYPTISVTADPNSSSETRTGTFTIVPGNATHVITQQGIAASLTVNPTNLTLGSASNSNDQINVTSNVSWSASDDATWLSVTPASSSNNGTITVTATSANTSTSSRSGTVTITGSGITRTVSVTQSEELLTPILTINPTNLTLGSTSNSSDQINVTSNVSWTASDDAQWLTVSPANGSNNGTISVTATSANSSTSSRSGIVTITGGEIARTVTVTQSVPIIIPSLTVAPTSLTLGSASNSSDQINIISNGTWTARTLTPWLTVTPDNGSNNGAVIVTATSENSSQLPRNGTVTIYGSGNAWDVHVTQSVQPITPELTVTPSNLTLGSDSNSSDQINVTSNLSWTASDDAAWLSVTPTSGSNDGTITVTATSANTTTNSRSGMVTITGSDITRTVSVTQDAIICQPNWVLLTSTNTTTAYCKVSIKDIPASSSDKLGAFVGNECRGIGDIVINNNEAYSTIMVQGTSPETVSFRIWDASECSELMACGAFATNPGGTVGYPPNYLIVNVCTDKTQTLNLISGWNLASLYVSTDTKSPKQIFEGNSSIAQVKNMTRSWDPAVDDFLNTLQVLSKGEGYFIKTKNACNIEITGPYIGNDHSINLISGWNLIGYPYDICQPGINGIKSLLDNNKIVQLKNMTQSYDPLVSDFLNTLKFLTPGEGYFLKASSSYNNLIIYEPTVCTKSASITEHSVCDWQFKGYEKSTIAYGEITLNDLPVADLAYIGAFAGDECRSVMPLIQNEGKSYCSMVINGDAKEQIKFKLCVGGNVYESKTVIFTNPGESTQSIIPIPFNTFDEISQEPELTASPNPFYKSLEIKVRIFNKDDFTVKIYSTESKLIKSFRVDNANPGSYKFDWDATDFSGTTCAPGMYFIQLHGKTGSAVQKVIFDR